MIPFLCQRILQHLLLRPLRCQHKPLRRYYVTSRHFHLNANPTNQNCDSDTYANQNSVAIANCNSCLQSNRYSHDNSFGPCYSTDYSCWQADLVRSLMHPAAQGFLKSIWLILQAIVQFRSLIYPTAPANLPGLLMGCRLVFISPCLGMDDIYYNAGLYIINVDGSGLTPIETVPGGDFDPAWSPDGKSIAFTSLRTKQMEIFTVRLDNLSTPNADHQRAADR